MRVLLFVLIGLVATSCTYKKEVVYESAIQGFEAPDKKNGVYDLTISDQNVENFIKALQVYTEANDSYKISTMIHYPIKPMINEQQVEITTQDQFIANYDSIFNEKVKEAILKSTPETLFVNTQGFMIGHGQVWFAKASSTSKLVVIDVNNY